MLAIHDALQTLAAVTPTPKSEPVHLLDALHRVLTHDIAVPEPYPAFTRSLMDGYALHSSSAEADTDPHHTLLCCITETLTAGQAPSLPVARGQAARIMTGALLPPDCDCVVPQELAKLSPEHPDAVALPRSACRPGACILPAGALGKPGDPLLNKSTQLQPRHLAALAEFGIKSVPVAAIPTAAIISTGNEIVPFQQSPPPGRLRNSTQPMLAALLQNLGVRVISLQSAADSPNELDHAIHTALKADLLLLTGGVSVGLLDLVPAALHRANVTQLFHGVKLKPGKPLWAGIHQTHAHSTLVFGLPGNPVSSLVCCELFVRPAIRQMLGLPCPTPLTAVLSEPATVKGDRPVCQPAVTALQHGQLIARPVPWELSADLRSTAAANSMILLDPRHSPHAAGSCVELWLWDGLPAAAV